MRPPCAATCKTKCDINDDERRAIFKCYWNYGDLTLQRQFTVTNIQLVPKKRSRGTYGKQRSNTLICSSNSKVVCKTMFMNTLDSTERATRTALSKSDKNRVLEKDFRGSTPNRKYFDNVIEEVKNHIKSFPAMEAHYVRERCKRSCLLSDLCLATMYDLYKAESWSANMPKYFLHQI